MILSDALEHPTSGMFILADYYQTLLDALLALKRNDGQDFWSLIVTMPDGTFQMAQYQDLRDAIKAQGQPLLGETLIALTEDYFEPVPTVTHDDPRPLRELVHTPHVVTQFGVPVAVLGDPGRATVTGDTTLELAGLVKKESGLAGWGGQAPKQVEQALTVGESVGGDIKVAGGHIFDGDFVQQIFVGEGAQRQIVKEQFRVFESAFPERSVVGTPAMLGVAVYLPGSPSPFQPEEEPRQVVASDKVGVPMPVDPVTDEITPVDIEISLMAANFTVSGKATKYLTVWPDGRPAVRWFQLTPTAVGEHTIVIELSHDKRLLQEIRHSFDVEKQASLVTQVLKVVTTPLQFNFGADKA
jgi:hypothetical protein